MADRARPIMDAPIQWDSTGPFWPTTTGGKSYLPPAQAAQIGKPSATGPGDPRLLQWAVAHGSTPEGVTVGHDGKSQSFLHNAPEWNTAEGQWDQGINWNNLLDVAAGGMIGGGAVNALTTPSVAAPTAASAAAPTATAPTALGGVNSAGLFAPADGVVGTSGAATGAATGGMGLVEGGAIPAASGSGSLLGSLGGASGILDKASNIGGILSGAASGSANQRIDENRNRVLNQQVLQTGARDQFNAGLDSAKFQVDEQNRAKKNSILSQLLNNTQDSHITPGNPAIAKAMGTSVGGARPSNLTTNKDALMSLLGGPSVSAPAYQAPPPLDLQGQGTGEKILGGIGLGTSILGALTKKRAY